MKSNTVNMITGINQFLKLLYVLLFIFVLFRVYISASGEPKFTQHAKVPYELSYKQAKALSDAGVPHMITTPPFVIKDGKEVPLTLRNIDGTETKSRYSIDISMLYMPTSLYGMLLLCFKFAKILFIILGIYFLRKILTNTKQKHPFIFNNVQNLRRISYIIFAYATLNWSYQYILTPLLSQRIIPENSHSLWFTMGFNSADIAFVLLGFLVLTIASIFQHGYNMKQELDLTI